MTLEPLKPAVKKSGGTKYLLAPRGIIFSAVLVFGIIGIGIGLIAIGIGLGSGIPSTHYPTKSAICTSKVLELAQKGMVRDVGGFDGAIYECTHMHGFSSIYGEPST